jgi:hypothetical protein
MALQTIIPKNIPNTMQGIETMVAATPNLLPFDQATEPKMTPSGPSKTGNTKSEIIPQTSPATANPLPVGPSWIDLGIPTGCPHDEQNPLS